MDNSDNFLSRVRKSYKILLIILLSVIGYLIIFFNYFSNPETLNDYNSEVLNTTLSKEAYSKVNLSYIINAKDYIVTDKYLRQPSFTESLRMIDSNHILDLSGLYAKSSLKKVFFRNFRVEPLFQVSFEKVNIYMKGVCVHKQNIFVVSWQEKLIYIYTDSNSPNHVDPIILPLMKEQHSINGMGCSQDYIFFIVENSIKIFNYTNTLELNLVAEIPNNFNDLVKFGDLEIVNNVFLAINENLNELFISNFDKKYLTLNQTMIIDLSLIYEYEYDISSKQNMIGSISAITYEERTQK